MLVVDLKWLTVFALLPATSCLYGQEPRKFDATRGQLLANMAEMLVRQLEREWAEQMQKKKEGGRLKRSLAAYDAAYMMVDVSKPDWRVIYMNKAAQTQMGEHSSRNSSNSSQQRPQQPSVLPTPVCRAHGTWQAAACLHYVAKQAACPQM